MTDPRTVVSISPEAVFAEMPDQRIRSFTYRFSKSQPTRVYDAEAGEFVPTATASRTQFFTTADGSRLIHSFDVDSGIGVVRRALE